MEEIAIALEGYAEKLTAISQVLMAVLMAWSIDNPGKYTEYVFQGQGEKQGQDFKFNFRAPNAGAITLTGENGTIWITLPDCAIVIRPTKRITG